MADKDLVEWAEKAAVEHLRGKLASGDFLLTQANTLLSILLVGIGGGLGYAVKLAEASALPPYTWGLAVATAWLSGVAVFLVAKCVVTRDTQVLFNEPKNLCPPGTALTLDEVVPFELENMQGRIERTNARNAGIAKWLDRCRYATIFTPVVFAIAAGAVAYQ